MFDHDPLQEKPALATQPTQVMFNAAGTKFGAYKSHCVAVRLVSHENLQPKVLGFAGDLLGSSPHKQALARMDETTDEVCAMVWADTICLCSCCCLTRLSYCDDNAVYASDGDNTCNCTPPF